jgi:hypothetical protein
MDVEAPEGNVGGVLSIDPPVGERSRGVGIIVSLTGQVRVGMIVGAAGMVGDVQAVDQDV